VASCNLELINFELYDSEVIRSLTCGSLFSAALVGPKLSENEYAAGAKKKKFKAKKGGMFK